MLPVSSIINHWSACRACLGFFTFFMRTLLGETLSQTLTFRRTVFKATSRCADLPWGSGCWTVRSITLARLSLVLGNHPTARKCSKTHLLLDSKTQSLKSPLRSSCPMRLSITQTLTVKRWTCKSKDEGHLLWTSIFLIVSILSLEGSLYLYLIKRRRWQCSKG